MGKRKEGGEGRTERTNRTLQTGEKKATSVAARVLKMAAIGCTVEEIAAELDCSTEFVRARFARSLRRGFARLQTRMRRSLLESVRAGKVPAQIWLGRLYLERLEKERADSQPEPQEKDITQMTMSEMLAAYMKFRARKARRGSG